MNEHKQSSAPFPVSPACVGDHDVTKGTLPSNEEIEPNKLLLWSNRSVSSVGIVPLRVSLAAMKIVRLEQFPNSAGIRPSS
ncbi:hypothetical protein COP1_037899 [Malus domestica]